MTNEGYTAPVRGSFCPVNSLTTVNSGTNSSSTMCTTGGFILGCVSAWVVAYLHLVIFNWTDYFVVSLTYFFIIPLGGLIIGFSGALGVTFSNLFRTQDAPLSGGIIGIIIGLLCWYLVYQLLASDAGYDSVIDYIGDVVKWSEVIVGVEHHHFHHHADLREVPFLALLSVIVQPFGAIVGGFVAGVLGAVKTPNTSAQAI